MLRSYLYPGGAIAEHLSTGGRKMSDNSILRTEENGIEFYTIVATGECGMSQRGLALACGKDHRTIKNLENNLGDKAPSKWLNPFVGKDLSLGNKFVKNGGTVIIYRADFCAATIQHYAFKGSETAQDFLSAIGAIGLTSYIQSKTGWLPEQFKAAPAAHDRLGSILERPEPYQRLYKGEIAETAVSWFGVDFYWLYCYCFLTPEEKCYLNRVNPIEKGCRPNYIHQHLSPQTRTALEAYLIRVGDLVKSSTDKLDFYHRYQRLFHDASQLKLQLGL